MAHRDPAPEAKWQIWYQDMFDHECPRQVKVSGQGLVNGLIELWTRYLFETVQADGQQGLSHFNLWWIQKGQSIEIVGERTGSAQLKGWILANRTGSSKETMQGGNRKLLTEVAATHSHLVLAGQTSEAILAEAGIAANQQEFEEQLENLIA